MPPVLAVIPVKPFGVAKARLAGMLDAAARSRLGKAMAQRTAEIAEAAGATPLIVTGDAGVAAWAETHGLAAAEERGEGLNGAAATGVAIAGSRGTSWLVLHADLPLVSVADLETAIAAMPAGGTMLAPAVDGGTNVIGGHHGFRFGYGPSTLR